MPRPRLPLILVALLFVLFALASPGAQAGEKSNEKIKVIIDTDIAEDIDDILVTAFAVASPQFEVLAITVVDGNVQARSRVARKVTKLFGHPQIPVAEGYSRSMPLKDTTYTGFSGGVRYGEVAPDEDGLPEPSPLRADKLIAELAEKYPGQVNLVTVGSMGNVGHLLVRYPEAVKKLKRIVTNGGRVLGVAALGRDVREARDKAYRACKKIKFEGMYYRKDIGYRALTRLTRDSD